MIKIDFYDPKKINGVVMSVNGKTDNVVLTAEDVHALPDTTVIPSVKGLASEAYVDSKIAAIPKPDMSNYYTKSEADEKMLEVVAAIPDVDLSDYYTKEEVNAALENVEVDLGEYYTKEEVNALLADLPAGEVLPAAEEVGF